MVHSMIKQTGPSEHILPLLRIFQLKTLDTSSKLRMSTKPIDDEVVEIMKKISDSANPDQEVIADFSKKSADNTNPWGQDDRFQEDARLKDIVQSPHYLHCKDESLNETSEEDTSTSSEDVVSVKFNELVSEGANASTGYANYLPQKKALNKERCQKHPKGANSSIWLSV